MAQRSIPYHQIHLLANLIPAKRAKIRADTNWWLVISSSKVNSIDLRHSKFSIDLSIVLTFENFYRRGPLPVPGPGADGIRMLAPVCIHM